MNKMAHHDAFEHLHSAHIDSLDIDLHEFRHKGTGARHIHLAADHPESVFMVGLRTVPKDSTGVAHILEHTVLCGSERYPVRDPFFMMIRRSLNTFMNAFTSSDWTAYPFATQNEKDFHNLLDVYLDAVFFPNLNELDFAQEGHRVEFAEPENPDSPLVFKGVVFNEMKGAMSSPLSMLWQSLGKHLFINNTYHFNSGGDPDVIPDLTYDELKAFHDTHYHPSNAVFMTFGKLLPADLQARFDERVLTRFGHLGHDVRVEPAQRYYAPLRVEEAYAHQEKDLSGKTHIVLAWLLGESIDIDARLEAYFLSSILLDNSASPLMKALEQSELGASPSMICGVDDNSLEMPFMAGLDGSDPEHTAAVETLILDVLEDVARNGVPREQIDAVLHQLELSQREIRGDGMPFGLSLLLGGLSTAMQGGDTLAAIDLDPALERLREKVAAPDHVQTLVKRLLLDNPHRITLTLHPDGHLSERRVEAEKQRLERMKVALEDGEAQAIIERTRALIERQAQEDDPEILPKVTRVDIPATIDTPQPTNRGGEVTTYASGTNGLVYHHIALSLPEMPTELAELLPFYTSFLTDLGSGGRNYLDTQMHAARTTGGVFAYALTRGAIDDVQNVSSRIILRGKALARNAGSLAELLRDSLLDVRFDELDRLRELVAQTRTAREQHITGSGHSLAMMAAASGMNPVAESDHRLVGLASIPTLRALDQSLADKHALQRFAARLEEIHARLKSAPRELMVVAEEDQLDGNAQRLLDAVGDAPASTDFKAARFDPVREQRRQLWTTSTEVNFCARAYPSVAPAHEDAAALAVLGPMLRNGYLHRAIRENGGAYGGGATQHSDTASFRFYSYRDPRLGETLADFDRAIEWVQSSEADEQQLEEALLNVISGIDKPGSPAGEARHAWQAELFGRSGDFKREQRQRIIDVTLADVKSVADRYFDRHLASTAVLTSAGEEADALAAAESMDRFQTDPAA
ncbi:MAG: peptidase M16 [Gammaproteobacteria bacterium]|nr:MAG: peptidase M16 [Gammaproteobacteria bacterium]